MTGGCDDVMRRILGAVRWDGLSEGEKAVARDVAEWFGVCVKDDLVIKEQAVMSAIWSAVEDELGDRAELLTTQRRDRDLNDVRSVMFRLVQELAPRVSKARTAQVLGIRRHHSTVLFALRKCDELLAVDPVFRALYYRISRRTRELLGEEGVE